MDRVKLSTFADGSVKAVVYRQPRVKGEGEGEGCAAAFRPKRDKHKIVDLDDRLHWLEVDTGEVVARCQIERSAAKSRNRFLEYALNHTWEWFTTITIASELHDRYDVAVVSEHAQWLRNLRRRRGWGSLEYALVPELHKDGAIHFHSLLSGVPDGELLPAVRADGSTVVHGSRQVYSWAAAQAAWGWSTATAVSHSAASVRYMAKYMTKAAAVTAATGKGGGVAGVAAAGVGMRRWSVSSGVKRCDIRTLEGDFSSLDPAGWWMPDDGGEYESMVRWGSITDEWVEGLYATAKSQIRSGDATI